MPLLAVKDCTCSTIIPPAQTKLAQSSEGVIRQWIRWQGGLWLWARWMSINVNFKYENTLVVYTSDDACVFPFCIKGTLLMFIIGCAVYYQNNIDSYVLRHRYLRSLELDNDEWAAIHQVTEWLEAFRSATTQMSTTKGGSVLLTTHGIFRGLQAHIVNIIWLLPDTFPFKIRDGLINAYKKLNGYYYKFDQSPFYTWATHRFLITAACNASHIIF